MSIDAVAADAGVSKPTIYRRWSGKADLATAALVLLRAGEGPVKGRNCRSRLISALRRFRASLLRPNGMSLIGTVLAEEAHTPELLRLFRERVAAPRRALIAGILGEARAARELPPGADPVAWENMLIGSFYAAYLAGEPIPADWPDRVVAAVWPAGSR